MPAPRVAVSDVRDGQIDRSVRDLLSKVQFERKIRPDHTVFVKPNYAVASPRPGVTTSPMVLEAVLGRLKDRAARVLVGEADGGYASFLADESMARHGLPEICARTGAEMVNLSADPPRIVRERVLDREVDVCLSPVLDRVDSCVSVPVMKTHFVTTVSLGLKNLWGCDGDGMRLLRRKHLSRRLTLIAQRLQAHVTVVDATTSLDRYGPIVGTPVQTGHVVAGDNIVATDAACARMMGFDPARIEHIRDAARAGLGSIDASAVKTDPPALGRLHDFHVERRLKERLIVMTFRSSSLAKLVYASRITPTIYSIFGKTPKARLIREHYRR